MASAAEAFPGGVSAKMQQLWGLEDMTRKNHLITSGAALALAIAVPSAPAQQIEEVIVTAQKREESLQSVPMAVSAFTGEGLTDLGVTATQQLQAVTPGLVFSRTGPGAQPFLRGIGTRLAQNGMEPSVALYIDDRYEPLFQTMMFELADVERIEVIKGPQGTLYGRNATAGAIRVITRDVSDTFEGQVTASAGNYDAYGLSGTLNVPLTSTLGTRLTAMVKKRDGFAENLIPGTRSEIDDLDAIAARGKLRWQATDNLTANLTVGYVRRKDAAGLDQVDLSPPELSTGIVRGGITGDRDHVATLLSPIFDLRQFTTDLRFDVSLGDLDFVSITTYADGETFTVIDADGTSARVFDAPGARSLSDNYSQEFQLLSSAGNWNWIVGAYYFSGKLATDGLIDIGTPVPFSTGNQRTKAEAYALFGQATWAINDRWDLTLGGRWSYEEKEVTIRPSTMTSGAAFALVPFDDKADWDSFTPKLTLQRNFDDAMIYLTYSRGFKSGGYNYPARSPAGVGGALDPEILDMIELGSKSDFLDGRLRANAALYFYDYQDLQVTRAGGNTTGGTVLAVTENAANARVYGLDVDVTWLAAEHFTVTVGFNLSDSEYQDYDATARVFSSVVTGTPVPGIRDVFFDADGHSLLRSPDWSGFVGLKYDVQLGSAGRMPISLNYSHKDEYDFDFIAHPLSERLRQKSYGLLSARIGYVTNDDRWQVGVWGDNLTDKVYFDDLVGAGSGIRGSYGAPRTYGIDFTYRL